MILNRAALNSAQLPTSPVPDLAERFGEQ